MKWKRHVVISRSLPPYATRVLFFIDNFGLSNLRLIFFLNPDFSKKNFLDELAETLFPIMGRDYTKVSYGEILQIIRGLCRWLHVNVKKPSVHYVLCQQYLSISMLLLYDDTSSKHLNTEHEINVIVAAMLEIINRVANLISKDDSFSE